MQTLRSSTLDFHSKAIKSKVLSRFTVFAEDFIYFTAFDTIEVELKLDKKSYSYWLKYIPNNVGGKLFLIYICIYMGFSQFLKQSSGILDLLT